MHINCLKSLVGFKTPKVMGILNLTPDSFYDGGSYKSDLVALQQVESMLKDGANFIDVGGQSTRPTSEYLSADTEIKRIIPLIKRMTQEFPEILISVDTFYAAVAEQAVDAGAAIINDISGGNLDDKMLETVAKLQVPYIMMHMRGTPQTMQNKENKQYNNLIQDILYYFSEKIERAYELGVRDVIIDPGFGFSKTPQQNLEIVRKLNLFKSIDLPILMGVSRKSSICKTLDVKPDKALNGTTVLNTLSLLNGANILRVHDVREAWEAVRLVEAYKVQA